MATYTNTAAHTEYFAPTGTDRLWSRVPFQRAEAVLVVNGAAFQTPVVDSDQWVTAEAEGSAFSYGHTYQVPDDVDVLLHGIGLDADLTDEDYPAWLLVS